MLRGTQSNVAPQGAEEGSEDPERGEETTTLGVGILLAGSLGADPRGSAGSAGDDAGQPDLTVLSLDELLSLSVTGELTDIETAGEDATNGRGLGDPGGGGSATGGVRAWPGEPERGGFSRPPEDESGALSPEPFDGEALVASLLDQDSSGWLDPMA
jgi:hypothetical protein